MQKKYLVRTRYIWWEPDSISDLVRRMHRLFCMSLRGLRMGRFRATVCKTVHPMLSHRCLSVSIVTLVYCGQTVGWIKMPLGTEAGLGPDHIVLDGDPTPPTKRDTAAPTLFGPWMSIVFTRLDESRCHLVRRYRPRPRSRRHCVRWCPGSPTEKGTAAVAQFVYAVSAIFLLPVSTYALVTSQASFMAFLQSLAPDIASLDRYGRLTLNDAG